MRGSDQVPAPVPQTQTLAPAHYMSSEESIIIEIPSYGSLQLNLRNMQKDSQDAQAAQQLSRIARGKDVFQLCTLPKPISREGFLEALRDGLAIP